MRDLNLSDCELGPRAMQKLAPALARLRGLERLRLRGNELGEAGARLLAESALPHLTSLRQLALAQCELDAAAAQELFAGLWHTAALTKLLLAFNDLGEVGTAALVTVLPRLPLLRELNLATCGLSPAAAEGLAAGLRGLPALESLLLANNALGAAGAGALAEALPCLGQLRELDLGHCGLDPGSARPLCAALRHLVVLERLLLAGNRLGAEGAGALALVASAYGPSLRELNVSYAGLDAEALGELALAFRSLVGLEVLSLRNNHFGSAGVRALAGPLGLLRKLEKLDLQCCGLEADSLEVMAPGLAALGSLRTLELGDRRLV